MCQSTTMSTHRGSIANSINGELLSPNGSQNTKQSANQIQTTYNLSLAPQPTTTSSSSANDGSSNISTPSPAHFTAPPPPPLFYWPYPSPPLSPPTNYYATLQNGSNTLHSPLIGSVQSSFHISRPTVPLSICPVGNLIAQNPIASTSVSASHQTSLNHFINLPPLASPEIAKAV